jgi:hypothetical protein
MTLLWFCPDYPASLSHPNNAILSLSSSIVSLILSRKWRAVSLLQHNSMSVVPYYCPILTKLQLEQRILLKETLQNFTKIRLLVAELFEGD